MPPIRDHDVGFEDAEDDDGMPPLVDNPNPSMTFTFFTDMTPITFSSTEPTSLEVFPETSAISSPPASPLFPEDNSVLPGSGRVSHGKKRDASYIPRPPNAFILFRSSFIKSQQVPGKVEGNHSTLSKIIGMYWKTLPREEREQWEAKAVIAQAEHRKRYPDWRFRPGANAMAKLKVKDGPGTSKRRHSHRKGKEEAEENEKSKEKRCAKIADLLVEGKKGPALEAAVKEWEGDRKNAKEKRSESTEGRGEVDKEEQVAEGRSDEGETESLADDSETGRDEGTITGESLSDVKEREDLIQGETGCVDLEEAFKVRSKTPDAASDSRFKVPLTSMFRRSLSAPASHTRCPCPDMGSTNPAMPPQIRRDTVSFPMINPSICHPCGSIGHQRQQHEAAARRGNSNDAISCVLSSRLLPTVVDSVSTRCNDPFAHNCLDVPMPFSTFSTTPGFDHNPGASSPSALKEIYTVNVPTNSSPLAGGDEQEKQAADLGMTYSVYRYNPQVYSSYSTLKDWAGDDASAVVPAGARELPFTFASSSSSFEGGPTFSDNWDGTVVNDRAANPVQVSAFDTAFRWYGTDGGHRSPSAMDLHQYPDGLQGFDVRETPSIPATQMETGSNNYIFFPDNH